MKKIAFFLQHLECGGVENALISLLKKIDLRNNKITVYLIEKSGNFLERIPENVDVKEIKFLSGERNFFALGGTKYAVKKKLKEKKFFSAIVILLKSVFSKKEFAELNVDFNNICAIEEKFDFAINFHIHSPFLVKFLSEKVVANVKMTWIHNDFSTTLYGIDKLKKYLECNFKFYCVADRLKEEFTEIIPEYKNKTFLARNVVFRDEIIKKSGEFFPAEYTGVVRSELNILTVGRLEEQKGYDLAVKSAEILLRKGYEFKWFFVGDGTLRERIEKLIKKKRLKNNVFVLGFRKNPYPYFKNCDIYVQTSKHEGYVTTVTEAKIIHKSIVTTRVSGANEQVIDGETGYITDIDEQSISTAIIKLFNVKQREKFSAALKESEREEDYEYINEIFG